jgi:hypothetical protein
MAKHIGTLIDIPPVGDRSVLGTGHSGEEIRSADQCGGVSEDAKRT